MKGGRPAEAPAVSDDRVVAVISGGVDSTTMAYWLRAEGHSIRAISFDYGQRHRKEPTFAEGVAADLDAPWTIVDLHAAGLTKFLTGSALTDESVTVPDGHYADESMQATVVPSRNAIMLSIACALGVSEHATAVALGVHAGDHPVYPDCRHEFVSAFQAMTDLALAGMGNLRILAPLISMTKADIVRLGDELKVPFDRTWSCYKGRRLHCGTCGTCYERREAFALAGVTDPTAYDLG
jgi:7-cyano-7-deazaguanine synthase